MTFLDDKESRNDVFLLTSVNDEFESKYLAIREKEGRVLSDENVIQLPHLPKPDRHSTEWKLRAASTKSVIDHLSKKRIKLALDLGCGNGWFTNKLVSVSSSVIGMDMNFKELEQASRLFGNDKLKFCYGDIFSSNLPKKQFDIITLNACIQYFPDVGKLINRLLELINEDGEIHIIDSPFYHSNEVDPARERTVEYYTGLDFPEMADHYFHHCWDDLQPYPYRTLYNPDSLKTKLSRKLGIAYSPFPWIVIPA